MLQVHLANNFPELIEIVRNAKRNGTQSFSYRYLANKLGYRSPRSLAMVHKGQRAPSRELVQKLVTHLRLTPIQSELVSLLAEQEVQRRRQKDCAKLALKIERLRKVVKCMAENIDSQSHRTADELIEKFIYLTASEIEIVRQRIKLFCIEINCQHDTPDSQKIKFRFNIEIFKT